MMEVRGSETTAVSEKLPALVKETIDNAAEEETLDKLAQILPYDRSSIGNNSRNNIKEFLANIFTEALSEFNFRRSADSAIVVDTVRDFIEFNSIKRFLEIVSYDPSPDGDLLRKSINKYVSDRMRAYNHSINIEETIENSVSDNRENIPYIISENSPQDEYVDQTIEKGNKRVQARESPEPLDKLLRDNLTARGRPRIRRPMRSAAELGADPKSEEHRYDVKIGGRVPRELRDQFVERAKSRDQSQSAALVEAITDYLAKHGCDEPT